MRGGAALLDAREVLRCKFLMRHWTRGAVMRLIGAKASDKLLARYHRWPLLAPKDIKRRSARQLSVAKVQPQVFLLT